MAGQIIVLNGVSSSGKSSLAQALQARIKDPSIHWCIDAYLSWFQEDLWDQKDVVARSWTAMIRGFHAAAGAIARCGVCVILDDVLENDPPWLDHFCEAYQGLYVVLVGLHCPLDILEEREHARPERRAGMARIQFPQVHSQTMYDLEFDSSILSTEQMADAIIPWIDNPRRTTVIDQLRAGEAAAHDP